MIKRAWLFISQSDNFYLSSAIFGLSSLIAAGLNYLFYPVVAQLIDPREFGDVAAIISLSVQISSVLLALNVVSVFLVNNLSKKAALRSVESLQKCITGLFIILALLCVAASPALAAQLKVHHVESFILLGLILLFAVPAVFWTAYLQGHNKFLPIGVYNIAAAGGKLLFAVAFALLGWGVLGVLLGMIVGQLLGLAALFLLSSESLPSLKKTIGLLNRQERGVVSSVFTYLVFVLVAVGVASTLFAIDIVLAKFFFDPETAGLYSGIASIGRIVFYVCSPIVWIMLPSLTLHDPQKNRVVLRKSLFLTFALGAACVVGMWLCKDFIVSVSLGSAYLAHSHLLALVALSQLITAMLNVGIMYQLLLKQKRALGLVGLSLVGVLVANAVAHDSPEQLIVGFIGGQLTGIALYYCLLFLYNIAKRNRQSYGKA